MNRLPFWAFITLFAISCPILSADVTQEEIDVGKRASAEYEKEITLLADEPTLNRVNIIGQAVAKATGLKIDTQVADGDEKPDVEFVFKVVDDPDVNALAWPGGFVYINRGMLDYVQSDDELAAVLAHECGHVIHNHGIKLQGKYQRGAQTIQLATLLALVLAGDSSVEDVYGLSTMASWVHFAKTMEYTQAAEMEADRAAVELMTKTSYNPIAVLTLMDRFARDARRRAHVDWGVYRTHPPSQERSDAILVLLQSNGVPTDLKARRSVTTASVALAEELPEGEKTTWHVVLNDHEILKVAPGEGVSAADRAEQIADAINAGLDEGMRPYDIGVSTDGSAITSRGTVILELTPADVEMAGAAGLAELAKKVRRDIQYAIEKGIIEDL